MYIGYIHMLIMHFIYIVGPRGDDVLKLLGFYYQGLSADIELQLLNICSEKPQRFEYI